MARDVFRAVVTAAAAAVALAGIPAGANAPANGSRPASNGRTTAPGGKAPAGDGALRTPPAQQPGSGAKAAPRQQPQQQQQPAPRQNAAPPGRPSPGAAGASTFVPPRQPAAKPTTKPADPFGADSPKGAVKQFFEAYAAGNAPALRGILQASDGTEQRFLDAMVRTSEAQRKVRESAGKRFSQDAAQALTILAPLPPDVLASATEKVKGDTATVTLGGSPQSIVLRRFNARWRLAVFGMMQQQQAGQDIERTVADMNEFAGRLEAVADEIAAGKYRVVPEAKAAWYTAMGLPVPSETKRAIQMASAAAEASPKPETRNPKQARSAKGK
jgi:hypothetical protein